MGSLENAPQPLGDLALLIVETRLRIGEALQLRWEHIRLEPLAGASFGYLRVVVGKSKHARRNIPLYRSAAAMLGNGLAGSGSPWVFPNRDGQPYLVTSINHLHQKVRT